MKSAEEKRAYKRAWYIRNKDKCRDYSRKRKAENPERVLEIGRAAAARWCARNPDKIKAKAKEDAVRFRRYRASWHLKKKFGITLEERDGMLAGQGGHCAGCESQSPGWRGDWHVDHCHTTKRIRGILCHNCNTTLGRADDKPAVLRRLADYLESNLPPQIPAE